MEMECCPRCKRFAMKLVFGIACGCTVLTGHAEEPPHQKGWFGQTPTQIVVATSTGSLSYGSASGAVGVSGSAFGTAGPTLKIINPSSGSTNST
jgi:hypothetical protein